jgi:GTP cyclohydrolase IA
MAQQMTAEDRVLKVADAWAGLLDALGYDRTQPHLADTPLRVARFLTKWHSLADEPPPALTTFPSEGYDAMVVVGDIQFYSMCAHHGLPFFGVAAVGYIPNGKIVGLSKLARLVDYYARRFQTQECITRQVADHLERELKPLGVGVVLRGEHLCMSMRGINKPGHFTVTSEMRGVMREEDAARSELLSLVNRG